MTKSKTELPPVEWQITATAIHCDFVNDHVTMIVNKDWSTKCFWYVEYKKKFLDAKKQKFDKKTRLKIEKCNGPACSYVVNYRDKLIKEESGRNRIEKGNVRHKRG
jgi:hypothetical protein